MKTHLRVAKAHELSIDSPPDGDLGFCEALHARASTSTSEIRWLSDSWKNYR